MTEVRPRSPAKDAGIFLSYRRDDAGGRAGRLFDRLAERYGRERVFMDIDTIAGGARFPTTIEESLARSVVVIAMIGQRWADARDPSGARRLDDPNDFVRLEVAAALAAGGVTVVPVLVEGAQMPQAQALPLDLQELAVLQAVELSDARWNYDTGKLVLALDAALGRRSEGQRVPRTGWLVIAAVVLVALAAAGIWLARGGPAGTASSPPATPADPHDLVLDPFLRPGTAVDRELFGDLDGDGTDEIVLFSKAQTQTKVNSPQNYLDVLARVDGEWQRVFDATTFARPGFPEEPPPIQPAPTPGDVYQQVAYLDVIDMQRDDTPELVFGVQIAGADEGPLHLYVFSAHRGDASQAPTFDVVFDYQTMRGGIVSTVYSSVVLETGQYGPRDPMCCPSRIVSLTIGTKYPNGNRIEIVNRSTRPAV